jgi:hypothetical protein
MDQFNFLNGWMYPWLIVLGMVAAYLAASGIDATDPRTSLAIGIAGMASIGFRSAYGWWIFIHLEPQERRRLRLGTSNETRVWTGLISTLARWLYIVASLLGWLSLIALTVLSLSN